MLVMVPLDVWIDITGDGSIEVFVRRDELMDDGYQARIVWGFDADGDTLDIVCDSPNPGVRFRIRLGSPPPQPEPYTRMDTREFRVPPAADRVRVISVDQIRRARMTDPEGDQQ